FMPFVPQGKKSKKKAAQAANVEARERIIDRALGVARVPMHEAGLCLPMCVFLERLLAKVLPGPPFSIRLGALRVGSRDANVEGIWFDPRDPDGIDAGFHSWLEDANGALPDPSICLTLHSHGYAVDPQHYLLATKRQFVHGVLSFTYDEL